MPRGFEGKRVLVTGAARGIGLAAAMHFAVAGGRTVINDLSGADLDRAIQDARAKDLTLEGIKGNVTVKTECDSIVAEAVHMIGGIDILVNCAGVYRQGPSESFSEEEWDRTIDVNLKGTFFMTMAAMTHLRERNGNVVNLGSEAGLRGARLSAVYCASKGGVVLLTKALALEYAPGVRVNCVCPGAVDTQMMQRVAEASGDPRKYMEKMQMSYPLQRIAQPSEIAKAIAYLASDMAENITGAALSIDGGSTAGH